MHVAHRSAHVINMLDGSACDNVIAEEKPHYIVPGNRSVATDITLREAGGAKGLNVVPCARATVTMNREGDPSLAAEELGLPTSTYRFADSEASFHDAVAQWVFLASSNRS